MERRQPRSWLLLVWAITAVIYLALQFSPEDLAPTATVQKTTFPTVYSQGVVSHVYDKNGKLQYRLSASEISYQGLKYAQTRMQQPRITFFQDGSQKPWNLSADQAIGNNKTTTLSFINNVELWNTNENLGKTELTTNALDINTKEEFVHTNKPVTMQTPFSTTTATGMHINLKQEKINLLSDVRGNYAPL